MQVILCKPGSTKVIWILSLATSTAALARDPLQPGAIIHSHAGLGVIVGDDPSSLFYNPANLAPGEKSRARFRPHSELTVLALQTTYTHPQFETFQYKAVAPITLIGGSYEFGSLASIGIALFPTGIGNEIVVEGLPVDVTREDAALAHPTTKTTGYELAVGGSLTLPSRTRIGASIVQFYRQNYTHITIDGADEAFLDAHFKTLNHRFILGARHSFRQATAALSIAPAAVKRYSGSSRMPALGYSEPYEVRYAEYTPLSIGLAGGYTWRRFRLNIEYAYERHSAGRDSIVYGMNPVDPPSSNLLDTHNFAISGDHAYRKRQRLYAGIGYYPGNMGPGLFPGSRNHDDLGINGPRFGQFEAFNRLTIGGGWMQKSKSATVYTIGAHVGHGSLSMPRDTPGQGEYSLLTLGLVASAQWSY